MTDKFHDTEKTTMTDDEAKALLKVLEIHAAETEKTEAEKAAAAEWNAQTATWTRQRMAALVSDHGAVPPPWFYEEQSHPGQMMWRGGAGEHYMRMFWQWRGQSGMDEAERIAYFRKWSPPPRWMEWTADAIWNLEPWEYECAFDYAPYFAKLEAAGFEGVAEFEADFNDEKWQNPEDEEVPA